MRRYLGERLVVFEVVGELGALLLLAGDQPRTELALAPQPLAQAPHQLGVLGEALHEDLLGAVQGRLGVLDGGDVAVRGTQVASRLGLGSEARVGEQRLGQGLEPGLAGDLRLGTPLLLVRKVEVFEALLGVGGTDAGGQGVGELALLVDGGEHRLAALLELAQVGESLMELA